MNYGNIKFNDIADGPGVRVSLFVSGCRNHCKGCFQPETWDFNYGEEFTDEVIDEILDELEKPQYQGLTVLGGDPLEPENIPIVASICRYIKYMLPNKDIWLYTGYVIEDRYKEILEKFIHGWVEEIKEYSDCTSYQYDNKFMRARFNLPSLLQSVDVIVDGPFIEEQKDISLRFRGSKNQRIIDMNKTREQGKIVLWDGD